MDISPILVWTIATFYSLYTKKLSRTQSPMQSFTQSQVQADLKREKQSDRQSPTSELSCIFCTLDGVFFSRQTLFPDLNVFV